MVRESGDFTAPSAYTCTNLETKDHVLKELFIKMNYKHILQDKISRTIPMIR
jgi:hypothetical protein